MRDWRDGTVDKVLALHMVDPGTTPICWIQKKDKCIKRVQRARAYSLHVRILGSIPRTTLHGPQALLEAIPTNNHQ